MGREAAALRAWARQRCGDRCAERSRRPLPPALPGSQALLAAPGGWCARAVHHLLDGGPDGTELLLVHLIPLGAARGQAQIQSGHQIDKQHLEPDLPLCRA